MKRRNDRVPIWNIWWTLTVLSAAFTMAVVILEYLGVFRDVGIVLGALGVIATLVFGISASTRSSVQVLEHRLAGVDDRLVGVDDRLAGVDDRLASLDDRLVGLDDRLVSIDDRLVGVDKRLAGLDQRFGEFLDGQRTTNDALSRIEELLRTRLPA